MQDDADPIAVGEMGTVIGLYHREDGDDLWHQIDVKWDHGRNLMLTLPPDRIEILCDDKRWLFELRSMTIVRLDLRRDGAGLCRLYVMPNKWLEQLGFLSRKQLWCDLAPLRGIA